jgi:hypothetical protein
MKDKLLAAVFGGLLIGFVGILRAIPGVGSYLTCCGCLATITGGALATAIYARRSPVRVTTGDGASVGALSGMIAGLIHFFMVTPLTYFTGNYTVDLGGGETEELKIIVLIGMSIVIAILITIIATIGGAIGVPLFERRKPEPAGFQQGGYGNPGI